MSRRPTRLRARGLQTFHTLDFGERGLLAHLQHLLGRGGGEEMHEPGDDPGPAGLVARAEAGAVVAVEIFVEVQAVAPVRILLEFPGSAVDGPPSVLVAKEDG